MSSRLAQEGEKIRYTFPPDHDSQKFAGKTFTGTIGMVNVEERMYYIYAQYGIDKIPFEEAEIINKETVKCKHLNTPVIDKTSLYYCPDCLVYEEKFK